jgi:hypothetical protein
MYVGLLLALASCKSPNPSSGPPIIADLGIAISPGAQSCEQELDCVRGCLGDGLCVGSCESDVASVAASDAYQALFNCGLMACEAGNLDGSVQSIDGGAPACASANDLSTACLNCITDAENADTCDAQHEACTTTN